MSSSIVNGQHNNPSYWKLRLDGLDRVSHSLVLADLLHIFRFAREVRSWAYLAPSELPRVSNKTCEARTNTLA